MQKCKHWLFGSQPQRALRWMWIFVYSSGMGRIVASVQIDSVADRSKSVRCDALVDTGASHMVLPTAWKERLGSLESTRTIQLETATQEILTGEVCGPVRIQIEGFPAIYTEVSFFEMKPENGEFEPLIGYIVLEQSQAGVDILGHRLVPLKHMDLKVVRSPSFSCWDSVSELLEELPVPEWHRAELERRLAAADGDPNGAIPWEDVRLSLRKKSGAFPLPSAR